MWFRLPSGTLVNLDKVSRIGISERSPEMRTGARYRVYAVDDSTDYTLYESDSLQDCRTRCRIAATYSWTSKALSKRRASTGTTRGMTCCSRWTMTIRRSAARSG